jgi:hypothetical protein
MSVAQTVQGNSLNLQRCHLLRKLLGEPMRRPHLAIPSGGQQVIVGCATHAKTQTLFLLFHQVGAEFSDVATASMNGQDFAALLERAIARSGKEREVKQIES